MMYIFPIFNHVKLFVQCCRSARTSSVFIHPNMLCVNNDNFHLIGTEIQTGLAMVGSHKFVLAHTHTHKWVSSLLNITLNFSNYDLKHKHLIFFLDYTRQRQMQWNGKWLSYTTAGWWWWDAMWLVVWLYFH